MTNDEKVSAIGVPKKAVDDFSKQYQILVYDVSVAERQANDIQRMVDANFAVYKLISSFLETIRSYVKRNDSSNNNGSRVMVSVHDLDTLESEREMRLLRSIVASNAKNYGLGNSFLAAIDPNNLKRTITTALNDLSSKADDKAEDDESNEEKNPQTVNLDNNGGLYSIRGTEDAMPLDRLIGYGNEARELVSFCRRVDFVTSDNAVTDNSRNPVSVILYGPPGTGKTTIAQSIAKYLDCVYMYVNAENVTSQWAGGTEKNIAKLFRRARIASIKYAVSPDKPRRVLMLIDEIDGLIKNRATSLNLTGEEYGRITTFLQQLTPPVGTNNSNIVAIFTTNRLENLDSAVTNRARGKIFMGYVVSPAQRYQLALMIFNDYVRNGEMVNNQRLMETLVRCDDLVPRDFQNVLAQVKNRILERYANTAPTVDLRIDLSVQTNRIGVDELIDLLNVAAPATPADVLFRDYSPPVSHVCDWLRENAAYLQIARSAPYYNERRDQCA